MVMATDEQDTTAAELLTEADLSELCIRSRELLLSEPAFIETTAPIVICGDTHGQFSDLLRILFINGLPPDQKYLFLGDYVDRGPKSIETVTLLMAFKLKYPKSVYLLRGNHEAASVNKIYGFMAECRRRFSMLLWKQYGDVFNVLPFAALVSQKIFCMHGGISEELKSWNQIRRIQRPCEVPDHGLLSDLLWNDPNPDKSVHGFEPSARGIGKLFAADVAEKFCKQMRIDLIARAHQVVPYGYEFYANKRVVTIFSAPNYCGDFENDAAVMKVDEELRCSLYTLTPIIPRKPPIPPGTGSSAPTDLPPATPAAASTANSNTAKESTTVKTQP